MKKFGPVLGITGAALMVAGLFLKATHLAGASIVYSLGVLIFNFGFLPYMLLRQWKDLNTL